MTYNEALGLVVWGITVAGFCSWYVWCVYTMFFRCSRPREFFSGSYSTSGPFVFINCVAAALFAAFVIMAATN